MNLTEDEIAELMVGAINSSGDGELDEDSLDEAAGGVSYLSAFIKAAGVGARIGIAARMVYDKYKYGNPYKNYNMSHLKSGRFWE